MRESRLIKRLDWRLKECEREEKFGETINRYTELKKVALKDGSRDVLLDTKHYINADLSVKGFFSVLLTLISILLSFVSKSFPSVFKNIIDDRGIYIFELITNTLVMGYIIFLAILLLRLIKLAKKYKYYSELLSDCINEIK